MENQEIKKKILIIEKNEETLQKLDEILSFRYDLTICTTVEQGLQTLRKDYDLYALVLLSLSMEERTPAAFLKTKANDVFLKKVPLLVLIERLGQEAGAVRLGALGYLLKPFKNVESVQKVVSQLLDKEETPALRIENLHKSYGKKKVLKGLSLEVKNGELFGFIGRNGVGKSTTIDCVIGVKRFDSGQIEIEGFSIKEEPLIAKSRFGYVASEPTCYESMTGYEYLEFIASIYRISEAEFSTNVEYLTKRLALTDEDLSKYISAYSHGMKQKLCLIASLLNNPDVWILDEPTVGLDVIAVEELKSMMREYANHGKCVFITSHNIEIIAKICDRVAIINDGVVVELMDLNKDPNKRLQLPRIFLSIFGEK